MARSSAAKRLKAKPAAGGTPAKPPREIDGETRHRARKVYGLATMGGTEGERQAAKARMMGMAAEAGMQVAAFLKACGLPVPEKERIRVPAVTVPIG